MSLTELDEFQPPENGLDGLPEPLLGGGGGRVRAAHRRVSQSAVWSVEKKQWVVSESG